MNLSWRAEMIIALDPVLVAVNSTNTQRILVLCIIFLRNKWFLIYVTVLANSNQQGVSTIKCIHSKQGVPISYDTN